MSTYSLADMPAAGGNRLPEKQAPARAPALADGPLWPTPEEVTGRRWLIVVTLIGVLGLYAWALAFFDPGAHWGVDQNGYLMTARLITGEQNVFAPRAPAPAQATSQPAATAAAGGVGGVEEHPGLSAIQKMPLFDGLRNRLSFVPESPFQFAGRMCIITEPFGPADPAKPAEYRVYAKYPFGYPLLAAIGRMIGGYDGMYLINPLCTVLACYFAYFLFRQAVSPFVSLLGVIWLACNPLVFYFGNDANSHATTLMCVTMGFWGVLSWLRTRQNWRAWIGGFALGYACTIRYSEFLLVLPVAGAAVMNLRLTVRPVWRLPVLALCGLGVVWGVMEGVFYLFPHLNAVVAGQPLVVVGRMGLGAIGGLIVVVATLLSLRTSWRAMMGSLSLMTAWAIPIAALAFVCWIAFGAPWKTGYTYCHESTGFAWKYLTGNFGDPSQQKQGNWETLITQMNHMGLFVLWPLAVAGLFAMLGSAWRLGAILALWVLPSTALYMLYYWAPTGENTLGYLRFFISILPGLTFAGLWVLDRGLAVLQGSRRASLVAITAFGVFLLVAIGLYFDDTALEVGPRALVQIGMAVWDLVTDSRLGCGIAAGIVAIVAGIWVFDRPYAASRTGMALGAGVLTAIGCGMNLYNILPQIEAVHANYVGLRQTVDNLRERAPKGSVLFSNDRLLNQLDAVGDWKLMNASLFTQAAFFDSKRRVDSRDKDKDTQADPDPIQLDRSKFYEEVLGKYDPKRGWVPRTNAELQRMELDIIEKNLQEGRRVMFIQEEMPGNKFGPYGGGKVAMPTDNTGYVAKVIWRWDVPPAELPTSVQNVVKRGRRAAAAPAQPAAPLPVYGGASYQLYELVKAPPAPKAAPAAATAPATGPKVAAKGTPVAASRPAKAAAR